MVSVEKFHRAFGVYGILIKNGKLLVINKSGGPYKNRFDLPGGNLEDGEGLFQALRREFEEETGIDIEIKEQIGAVDFMLPWDWKDYTAVHHIAIFYLVNKIGGEISEPEQFDGQDSLGAVWVSKREISQENASPLVLKAFQWLRTGEFGIQTYHYRNWEIKQL
ncbi:ADP-ribose pyrophosphatase YjhB (NUDIX family) [Lederbergia galactosidilyticus]|uniref:NUDIX hydrolase n=1 Tax=Lederbergia galactosidilytica TaxID=217031 RepID=UPI001AE72CFA|nr:NUDIX hydrolase [Lederbergia galactosidilytica]MBP1914235.1 ADP-ribose pyrophosphatase YjhB (NUDIX family) [Lederbergia galactosidilytica]